jgi:hypothetical protein
MNNQLYLFCFCLSSYSKNLKNLIQNYLKMKLKNNELKEKRFGKKKKKINIKE